MGPIPTLLIAGLVLGLMRLARTRTNESTSAGSDVSSMDNVSSSSSSEDFSNQGQGSVSDPLDSSPYGSGSRISEKSKNSEDYSSSGS